jgi:hypothetical protein
MILIPLLFKGKVKQLVADAANDQVNATVSFSDVNLSLFKSFPFLSIGIEDLMIINKEPFEGDTLIAVKNFAVAVDIMSVISGSQISVREIHINSPKVNLSINESGMVNWDIMKPGEESDEKETDEDQKPFSMKLRSYTISGGSLVYDDRQGDMRFSADGLDHRGSGDFTSSNFTLQTITDATSVYYYMDKIAYLNDVSLHADAVLDVDLDQMIFTLEQNEFGLNQLRMKVDGFIAMPDDAISMDISFHVLNNEFRNFMSMIPGVYREGFEDVRSSGTLEFQGNVKGVYDENTLPAYNITLNVNNGEFQYPDLPEKLSEVNIDLNISNPDGVDDNTIIDLKKLHLLFGEIPLDAALYVRTPVSDPYIEGFARGAVDLGKIKNLIPLEEGESVEGSVSSNISLKGKVSAVEEKRYQDFHAEGNLIMKDFKYTSTGSKLPIEIPNVEFVFNPRNVTVNDFELRSGNTSMTMNGWVDNFLQYYLKDNELLRATLDINAQTIDLNELYPTDKAAVSEEGSAPDSVPGEVIAVPEYVDFMMTMKAEKILYDNLILDDFTGNLGVRDRTLGMNDVSFKTLQGNVSMDGIYQTKKPDKPEYFFNFRANKIDIREAYEKFGSVQKLAPIAEKCSGKASAVFRIQGLMDQNMEPDLNSASGYGKLQTHNVVVENFKPLVEVANVLNMDQLKKAEVSDVNLSFTFTDGVATVEPFDVEVEGFKSTISGTHKLDQTIDYDMVMQVPMKMLGGEVNSTINSLVAQANSAGANFSTAENIPVTLKITGTVDKPVVKADVKESANKAIESIKDKAKEEFDRQKKELEEKARQEAEKLKKEAEQKAQEEMDRLKKEAEERAKKEADKLKKEAEEKLLKEAEDKLKNLFGKPK